MCIYGYVELLPPLNTGKVGEQIQMTTDTMIKGDSTKFGACSLPLNDVLMYLNPNPNPDPNPDPHHSQHTSAMENLLLARDQT